MSLPSLWLYKISKEKIFVKITKDKLNIIYDGPYTSEPKAGVVKYFRELSKNSLIGNSIAFSRYQRGNKDSGANVFLPFPHFRPHKISFYLEYMWHKFFYQKKSILFTLRNLHLLPQDIFFLKKGAKLVITIHDLIHEKFGTPEGLYDLKTELTFTPKQMDTSLFQILLK